MSCFICPLCSKLLTEPVDIPFAKNGQDYHPVINYCGHIFHRECLFKYLELQRAICLPLSCPKCQQGVQVQTLTKLLPQSHEKFQNYSKLANIVKQRTLDLTVIFQELEVAKQEIVLAKEASSHRGKIADEQGQQIKILQRKMEKLQKRNSRMTAKKQSITNKFEEFRSNWESASSALETKGKSSEKFEAFRADIIQVMKRLKYNGDELEEEIKFSNANEIMNEIGEILINRPLGDTETSGLKELFMETPLPRIIIQKVMFGMPPKHSERKIALECVEVVKGHRDIVGRRGVTIFFPRGDTFFPSLELFQMQLITFLRAFGILYKREIVDIGEENPPVMGIADQIIYAPEACCEILLELFIFKNKRSPPMNPFKINTRMLKLWKLLSKGVFPAILLWQWSYDDNGNSMEIAPKGNARVVAAVKRKVEEMVSKMRKGNFTTDKVSNRAVRAIRVLSEELDTRNYFNGTYLDEIDCSAFVLLSQLLWNSPKSDFQDELRSRTNLMNFVNKMKRIFWPEWESESSFPKLVV